MTTSQPPSADALIAALAEIDRYVSEAGWDQPARLFALVPNAVLIEAEPTMAAVFADRPDDALSVIEQEHFHVGDDLVQTLATIGWPPHVAGTAMALERSFLPVECEDEIPGNIEEAAAFVANHPLRQDVRVVVGALRSGITHGLARLTSNPEELLGADDLVPGLSAALLHTLDDGDV